MILLGFKCFLVPFPFFSCYHSILFVMFTIVLILQSHIMSYNPCPCKILESIGKMIWLQIYEYGCEFARDIVNPIKFGTTLMRIETLVVSSFSLQSSSQHGSSPLNPKFSDCHKKHSLEFQSSMIDPVLMIAFIFASCLRCDPCIC